MTRSRGWVAALVLLAGCVKPEPTPAPDAGSKDHIEYELGPRTIQLTEADLTALEDGADVSKTLRFDASVGQRFTRGDVLLAGVSAKTPRGLLRVVSGTTTTGAVTAVETELAPLQLAFSKLHAHLERTLPVEPVAPQRLPRSFSFGGVTPVDFFVFNGDGDPATLEDQLHLDDAYQGEVGLTMDLDFEWGFVDGLLNGIDDFLECAVTLGFVGDCPDLELPKLSAKVTAQLGVASSFDHAGAASAAYAYGPFAIGEVKQFEAIPLGPLVIIPELQFEGRTEGRAGAYARLAGRAETGFSVSASVSTADGVQANAGATKRFVIDSVEAVLDGHVKTSVGPTLRLLAFGAIGPTVGADFTSELDVDRTRAVDDCYRANLGIDGRFGFVVRFPWRAIGTWLTGDEGVGDDLAHIAGWFGLDGTILEKTQRFSLLNEEVARGACMEPPPGVLPPGSPDPDTFANPSFQPWARRFDEPGNVFEFSASPVTARGRTVLGVDGHAWVLGAPSPTLRRVTLDGELLTATRFMTTVDQLDQPLPVTDVLERIDLYKWVLFTDGTIARLAPDLTFIDAFTVRVPFDVETERVTLRRGATRADGRTALLFGVSQLQNTTDHRLVLVELDRTGNLLRSRALGEPTAPGPQADFFTAAQLLYRDDGALLVAGQSQHAVEPDRCELLSLRDDGAQGFATQLEAGDCDFGALALAPNGDVLLTGSLGRGFGNDGVLLVLDAQGEVRSAASFTLGSGALLSPTSVERLPSVGFVVTGRLQHSATQDGLFVARLDAQGVPLTGTNYLTPVDVSVGYPDAFVTNDAAVFFGALADWGDVSNQRELTRTLVGKGFAKDGALPFSATSGLSAVSVTPTGAALTMTSATPQRSFSDVAATVEPRDVRAETVVSDVTTLAP